MSGRSAEAALLLGRAVPGQGHHRPAGSRTGPLPPGQHLLLRGGEWAVAGVCGEQGVCSPPITGRSFPCPPAVPGAALQPPALSGRSFPPLSHGQACTAGTSGPILAGGKGLRVEQAQGGKGHPRSDLSSAPYAASVPACSTSRVPRVCPLDATLSFSLSQTPPGMSPSAGAYLQMAVSFNYRCLALFTDTGYIWMGLATLKVSVHRGALGCRPPLLSLPGRQVWQGGCPCRSLWGTQVSLAAAAGVCAPALRRSTLVCSLPDFIPYSPLFPNLPFCWPCTPLSLSNAPPQINSPPQIASPLLSHRSVTSIPELGGSRTAPWAVSALSPLLLRSLWHRAQLVSPWFCSANSPVLWGSCW